MTHPVADDLEMICDELEDDDVLVFLSDVVLLFAVVDAVYPLSEMFRGWAMESYREANRRLKDDPEAPLAQAWFRLHMSMAASYVAARTTVPDGVTGLGYDEP